MRRLPGAACGTGGGAHARPRPMPPFPAVAHQLEQLQARRAAQARVMRRRRRAAAAIVVAVAAVVAVAIAVSQSGGTAHHQAQVAGRAAATKTGRTVVHVGRKRAELAAVARLARHGLPVYCGGRSKPMVALTFDDGPGPYTTLAIRKLREQHLHATFFLVGKSIRAYPSLARQEKAVAMVGDHTMTHPFLPGLSHDAMAAELGDAKSLIEQASGQPVALFRPPYGARTPAIDAEARSLGLLEVLWTVDSRDSLGANYAGIEQNVTAGLHPGSIILMHENRGQTIRALPVIFAALARDHLRAVTVPQLIADDPPSLAQLRAGPGGCGTHFATGSS
jgi:peptidoglycan-N-acetylglucosamine deacetylase